MSHVFKKKYGQNFLTDKNLLDAIVRDAGITKCDEVLEIGAGAGALTSALAKVAKKVVSYEIDKSLDSELLGLGLKNTEFIFADALKADISEIESHFSGEYKLVANLPYYITTPLIFKFLEEATRCTSLTIMVQEEVATRLVSAPGTKDYGVLTVMINFFGRAAVTRKVGRQMFYPVPNVDSAVVHIDIVKNRVKSVGRLNFSRLVKSCFSMRRKTLYNNLVKAGYNKERLNEKFSADFLSRRAETLSLDDFIALYIVLEN